MVAAYRGRSGGSAGLNTQRQMSGYYSVESLEGRVKFIESLSRLWAQIRGRFCRHQWRPSKTDVTASVCVKCGKRATLNGPGRDGVYLR